MSASTSHGIAGPSGSNNNGHDSNKQNNGPLKQLPQKDDGKVHVYYRDGNKVFFVGSYNEVLLCQSSSVVGPIMGQQHQQPKMLYATNVRPDALKYVFDAVIRYGSNLRLQVSTRPLDFAVHTLNVLLAFNVQPAQPLVENTITYRLSHQIIRPIDMVAVQAFFGAAGHNSRVWRIMVHHIAYDIANGRISGEHLNNLNVAALKYPALATEVKKRISQQMGVKAARDEQQAKWEAERAAKLAAKAKAEQAKKKVAEHKKLQEQKKLQKWEDEELGLRTASEETVEYVMSHSRGAWFTKKMTQRELKELHRAQKQAAQESGRGDESGDAGKGGKDG